jgi:ferrous iron transport protein B
MARAAYVMDNLMQAMGLQGRSFLPLFLGFGCNVPAIMGTRVIDSKSARLLTILIAPLIPCTARMAVVAFIAPAFLGTQATLVTWGMVTFSIIIMVLLGILLNRVLFKGERSSFIMELPSYHIPNPRTIGLLVWQRSLSFVRKAGTIILAISVLIWLLTMIPSGNLDTSYLAGLGKLIAPVGEWMGFDWRLTVAILTSFLAKENSIATLGVLFSGSTGTGISSILASTYSSATALSFLVVSLLFVPCAATVATIKQETNSYKWMWVSILIYMVLSVVVGTITYNVATWIGL